MSRRISGFSLIEIAIVLIIIGLISGMALPSLKAMLDWQKTAITAQNQEKILYALASYAIQNKSLPYAANPLNSQEKPHEIIRRRRGIVPYAALGLPESTAKDGYHRWFTYVVDDYYTVIPKTGPPMLSQQPISRLCEKQIHLNPLTIKGLQGNVAVVLISHGPQGRGAYPNPLEPEGPGSDEKQNATSDTEIIDRPINQNSHDPFSHKVVWVTASNLLALYGRAPCPPVEDIPKPSNLRLHPGENVLHRK